MRYGALVAVIAAVALSGCLRSVTIPPLEASLKDACGGKDRVLASAAGLSAYRCGEGDQARYAVYKDGSLLKEGNEIEVIDFAAAVKCLQDGHKLNSPEHAACRRSTTSMTLAQAGSLRQAENAQAERRRQAAIEGLAAAGAAMSAATAASQPQTVRVETNCSTLRTGTMVTTNCF